MNSSTHIVNNTCTAGTVFRQCCADGNNELNKIVRYTDKVLVRISNFKDLSTEDCGPGSSVSIATDYGPDSPGSNPGGGEIFYRSSDRPWGPPSLLYNGCRVFPGGKAAGAMC
jgi:hypothetical protein